MTLQRTASLLAAALLAAACSASTTRQPAASSAGPTPPGGNPGQVAGIALPTEVSALPTSGAPAGATLRALAGVVQGVLAADSDYATATSRKWVNEHALDQFTVLNTIFNAAAQTHYADAANVNAGPYGATVSWVEDQGKQIVLWVVDSTVSKVDGADVNALDIWMNMVMGDGQMHLILASLRIYQAPALNGDGSYADYGVWKLEAWTGGGLPPAWFFAAEARHGAPGESVVALHQLEASGETVGILHKSAGSGYGKVQYPDWDQCHSSDCAPPPALVAYAYDGSTVAIQKNLGTPVVKDRGQPVDVVNRYRLFDADSGDDVARTRTFGFPFSYSDGQGHSLWGNYGAWQGRHQIWANGQALAEGTQVVRSDVPSAGAPTFTASKRFTGVLTRRTLVPGTLDDVKDVVLGTWLNRQVNLVWNSAGSAWQACIDPDWSNGFPPSCGGSGSFADADLGAIFPDPSQPGPQNVWLSACGGPGPCVNLAWDPAGASGPGLYLATSGQNGQWVATGSKFQPADGAQVWGSVNLEAWIAWDGAAWLQKALTAFDAQTNTPTFAAADQDRPFAFQVGRDYNLGSQGVNYVVAFDGASYAVKIERQTVARPDNAAAFAPAGTLFRRQWGDTESRFALDTAPASPTFLKLTYQVVGSQDALTGVAAGDVLSQGQYGLVALTGGVAQADPYNWDFPSQPTDGWGSQQFLVDGSGHYVYVDDPIRLSPVVLTDGAGNARTYALFFDGNWVGGLPDIWSLLQNAGYQMTPEIAAQVVVIPDGTQVTDGTRNYLFKAVEVQEFLPVLPGPTSLSLGAAAALDLGTAPAFDPAWSNSRAQPDVPVKYSEGVLVH